MSYLIQKFAYDESMSKKSIDTKQHFGCVILDKKKVVSRGHNFHSSGATQTCCCHAEMLAMYRHMKQLGIWKNFQSMLNLAYKHVPVFHRAQGKGG